MANPDPPFRNPGGVPLVEQTTGIDRHAGTDELPRVSAIAGIAVGAGTLVIGIAIVVFVGLLVASA